jgi:hypothetical protein
MAQKFNQDHQLQPSLTYDDTLAAGSTLESGSTSTEGDLNSIRSQIKRILYADDAGNWYDDIGTVQTLGAAKKYALKQLLAEVDSLEEHRFLWRDTLHVDVTVPASQNYVVLSVAGSEAPATTAAVGVVTTNGAVVAAATTFGAHNLDLVAGPDALTPLNLCRVMDGSTGSAVVSNDRQVYALLHSEVATDGHTFNDTTQQVQLSFVRWNAGGTALEAVPFADVENLTIHYSFTRRIDLDNIPEYAFIENEPSGGGGATTDELVKVTSNDTTPDYLLNKLAAGTNVTLAELNDGADEDVEISAADPTVEVSADDTTPGDLEAKIVAGTDISIATLNPGANEQLEISYSGTPTDELVKVTANDTTPDYLLNKLAAGTNVTITELNDGANEDAEISAADPTVKVSADDTTAGDLEAKIVAGTGISITTLNPAADEDLEISVTGTLTDELVKVSANDTTAGYLSQKVVAGARITINELNDGFDEDLEIVADVQTDPTVSVTSNDTTPDYLLNKLAAGSNISITELNDGLNEDAQIAVTGTRAGFDSTAIHDNVANEINAITGKATPVAADRLVIEDSAAAWAKKSIALADLPGGSGDVVGPGSSTDEAVVRFDGATGKLLQDGIVLLSDGGAFRLASGVETYITAKGMAVGSTQTQVTITGVTYDVNCAVHDDTGVVVTMAFRKYSATADDGVTVAYTRSRGTDGSETIVADGDLIARLSAFGHDGTDYERAAEITMEVDGTPAAGSVPGSIAFRTRTDGGSEGVKMTLRNDGTLELNDNDVIDVGALTHKDPPLTTVSSGTTNIDWTTGTMQVVSVGQDTTFTFTAPPGTTDRGAILTLRILMTGAGAWTITWPGTVYGTEPTLNPLTGVANSTLVQFLFDGTTGAPVYFFLSKGAVVDRWWGPWGLSYDMWNNQDLRFAWCSAQELTFVEGAGVDVTVFGPVDSASYPPADAEIVMGLADASAWQQDVQSVGAEVLWDTTYDGVEVDSTQKSYMKFTSTHTTDSYWFLHEGNGIYTIIMRVVFLTDPTANDMWLLNNTNAVTVTGRSQGQGSGTANIGGTITETSIRKSSCTINFTTTPGGATTATDDGAGGWTGARVTGGSINYNTGVWSITLDQNSTTAAMTADFTYQRGIVLRTSASSNQLVYSVVDGETTPIVDMGTAVGSTTGNDRDIAIVSDGTTVSMYLGDMGTADTTDGWVAATSGPSVNDIFIGLETYGFGETAADVTGSDFVIKGLVILQKAASEAELDDWLSWIGGTDFSDEAPNSSLLFTYQQVRQLADDYRDLDLAGAPAPVNDLLFVETGLGFAKEAVDTLPAFWDEVWEWDDITGSPVQDDLIQTWHAGVGGNNLTQATSGLRPTYYEGRWSLESDMLYFDADYVENSSVGVYSQTNVISGVVQLQDNGVTQVLWDSDTASARNHLYVLSNTWRTYAGAEYSVSAPADDDKWRTMVSEYSNTTSWIQQDYERSSDGTAGAHSLDGFRVGENQPANGNSDFMAQGFYISDGSLTDAQIATHIAYTKSKFGPFYHDAPSQGPLSYASAIWDAEDLTEGDGVTITSNWADQVSGLLLVPAGAPVMRTTAGPTGGKAIEFNGGDEFNLDSFRMPNSGGGTILVEVSFDSTPTTEQWVVDSSVVAGATLPRWAIGAENAGAITTEWGTTTNNTGTTNPRGGGWYAITAVNDNGTLFLYLNRTEENTGARTHTRLAGFTVGARYDSTFDFDGHVAWIGVWNYGLSAAEVAEVGDIRGWW